MSKDVREANKAIFDFICVYTIKNKLSSVDFFDKEKHGELKKLLVDRYILCRDAADPDKQREQINLFFNQMDKYIAMSPVLAGLSIDAYPKQRNHGQSTQVREYWSSLALSLLQDLKRNPDIHQGGYLRGRTAAGNHDCSLFLAILHRQLFGRDLVEAAERYPLTWDAWGVFMRQRFETLTSDLQNPVLPVQRQLWVETFASILETTKSTDFKRAEKFIYQVFLNIVNPFKTVAQTDTGYKTFAIPLTLIKANPTPMRGETHTDLMAMLQDILRAPLTQLRHEFSLPPATSIVITELKGRLKVTTEPSAKVEQEPTVLGGTEASWSSRLKVSHAVGTYGSINSEEATSTPISHVSPCQSSLYSAKVPQALHVQDRPAANDDCCACAIL